MERVKRRGGWGGVASGFMGIVGAIACVMGGCGGEQSAAQGAGGRSKEGEAFRIVCTTAMVADVARGVVGSVAGGGSGESGARGIEVIALMGEGVDPHLYQPTRADLVTLMSADVVFYNGLLLEGKFTDAFGRLQSPERVIRAVAEPLVSGAVDPHVWMDPSLWSGTVEVVRQTLAEARPEDAALLAANAGVYRETLVALDAYAAELLETVAPEARVLVTAHDAFGYFGSRYGFEVMGIQGISTESEAGLRDVERLVSVLVERRIPAVFVESTVSDRGIEALIAGAASRGHVVRIGGELFSDAMGGPGTPEATYVGMIEHNVRTITEGLGGRVNAGGFEAWRRERLVERSEGPG